MSKTPLTTLIIKYKADIINVSCVTDFVTRLGGQVIHHYPSINAISVVIPKGQEHNLSSNPNIESVVRDGYVSIQLYPEGSGTYVKKYQAIQTIPWGVSKINAPLVHQVGNKGAGIKVGVIDTGIDYNHPDLKDNFKGGYNYINNTSDPMDDHGHGTHVSGIIAAVDNEEGFVGVAPQAEIYALKVLDSNGSGTYTNVIAAIQWCIDNKMHIISMSLGSTSGLQPLEDICKAAYNAGILLVAAAGNEGAGTDTIIYPAKYDSVVAVGATNQDDTRASFSSTGAELEVSAPGVSIPSTYPGGNYASMSGTSMACPHASGTAALIMSANPNLLNDDVRMILGDTSVDLGDTGRDVLYGFGRIDAKKAYDNSNPLPPPPPEPPVLTKIVVSPPTALVIVGNKLDFKAKALDQDGNPMSGIVLLWAVSDSSIGFVDYVQTITDEDGEAENMFRAVTVGNTAIDVTSEDVTGDAKVSVIFPPPPPPETKFRVQAVDGIGVLVMKDPHGKYNATDACKAVCDVLKTLKK